MKKNVGSQSIGVQMITAADGTAFTGSVSVAVTVDNGTQGAGGGTAPAHEGNGYHSYTPTQAETNGDHIAFTFTGTGAIPATVQVFTGFPQTVDNNVLASGATGFAAIDTVVDSIKTKTDFLPSATAGAAGGVFIAGTNAATTITSSLTTTFTGNLTGSVGSVTGGATAAELAKVPKSDGTTSWNATALASINAECDTAISDAALATAASLATAQTDLDTITGADGVTLATSQGAITWAAQTISVTGASVNVTMAGSGTGDVFAFTRSGSGDLHDAAWITDLGVPVTNSLNTYDPPTNTEMEARTLVSANYATAAAQTTAQADLDIITGADGVNLLSATQSSVDAIEADTNELQGDWVDGGRLDLILDARMAEASISTTAGAVDTVTTCTTTTTNTDMVAEPTTLLTTQMTEAYAADGTAPTLAQALFAIQQFLQERSTATTTVTVKKLDGSTSAMTFTLDDATTPTSITRAT